MSSTVTQLWRYPIKAIGAEALDSVQAELNRPFPFDRAWAVLETGRVATGEWQRCVNFLRGAKGPGLMAVAAQMHGATLHLSHPEQADLNFTPGKDPDQHLIDWLLPIYPQDRAAPAALVEAPVEGLADVPYASVSIMNHSSRRALSDKAGRELDERRFRGNVWIEGLAPWEEFDLIGKSVGIGEAILKIEEPITRCRSTEGNPQTGRRDVDVLGALEAGWGHSEFGVNAVVTKAGKMAIGDAMVVL